MGFSGAHPRRLPYPEGVLKTAQTQTSPLLEVRIPGAPVTKARPQVTRNGTFTPKKTRDWEKRAGLLCRLALQRAGLQRIEKPQLITIHAVFVFPRPKRLPKKGPRIQHGVRPDLDNLVKALKDAMDGVLMADDAQITSLTALKFYAASDESPAVHVRLWEAPR